MSDLPQLLNLAKTQRRITSVTHATVFNISFCSHTIPYEGSLVVFVFFLNPELFLFRCIPCSCMPAWGLKGAEEGLLVYIESQCESKHGTIHRCIQIGIFCPI